MKACGRGLFSVRSPVAEEPGGIVVILQQGEFHMMEAVRLLLTMGSAGSFHFFIGEDPEGDVSSGLFQGFRGLAAHGHRMVSSCSAWAIYSGMPAKAERSA